MKCIYSIAQRTKKACSLLTYDVTRHSVQLSPPNAKGCDPATTDHRGGSGMTCIVKGVQHVLCHGSCHTSMPPCEALHLHLVARSCVCTIPTTLAAAGRSLCHRKRSHVVAARSPSYGPSQKLPFHSLPKMGCFWC